MSRTPRDPEERACHTCGKLMLLGGRGRPPLKTKYCSRTCLAFGRRKLPKIAILSEADAAYLAGVFDGEGSVTLYKRTDGKRLPGGRLQLRTSVANTDWPLIEWLQKITGTGSIVYKKFPKPEHSHYKDAYVWQCYGPNSVSLLQQIVPHLIVKREAALEAIESQK